MLKPILKIGMFLESSVIGVKIQRLFVSHSIAHNYMADLDLSAVELVVSEFHN
jgi:hypothetical protein